MYVKAVFFSFFSFGGEIAKTVRRECKQSKKLRSAGRIADSFHAMVSYGKRHDKRHGKRRGKRNGMVKDR